MFWEHTEHVYAFRANSMLLNAYIPHAGTIIHKCYLYGHQICLNINLICCIHLIS